MIFKIILKLKFKLCQRKKKNLQKITEKSKFTKNYRKIKIHIKLQKKKNYKKKLQKNRNLQKICKKIAIYKKLNSKNCENFFHRFSLSPKFPGTVETTYRLHTSINITYQDQKTLYKSKDG